MIASLACILAYCSLSVNYTSVNHICTIRSASGILDLVCWHHGDVILFFIAILPHTSRYTEHIVLPNVLINNFYEEFALSSYFRSPQLSSLMAELY